MPWSQTRVFISYMTKGQMQMNQRINSYKHEHILKRLLNEA